MRLSVDGLTIKAEFEHGEDYILRGADFCVQSGEPLAVVGESGSGKTMLALAIVGVLPKNCSALGSAMLDGAELIGMRERKKKAMLGRDIVYIPQSGAEYLNPSLKIKTQMYESLKKAGIKRSRQKALAIIRLYDAGIADAYATLEKYPFELSGGEVQRVALAIAMCATPKLVIADEPTKGIDKNTAALFWERVRDTFFDACVIVITHDIKLARLCDGALVLKDGQPQEYGASDSVLCRPCAEYTKRLIAAMPSDGAEDVCLK